MRVLLLASLFLICNFLSVRGGAIFAQQDDLVALYEQAKSAESSGDYKTAVAEYEKIIRLRPDMAEAYANAGNLYYLQGDAHHAELYFKKAIRLKPGLSGPYFFLGVLAFKGRAYPSALKYLKQAETLDAKNPLIQSYLGYTQFALHNYAEAVGHLEKAAVAAPEDIDVFYHLSKAYANVAKTYFERLQADYAGSLYTALARAHLYESQENWDLALQQYDAALKEHPSDTRLQQKRQEMVSRKGGNTGIDREYRKKRQRYRWLAGIFLQSPYRIRDSRQPEGLSAARESNRAQPAIDPRAAVQDRRRLPGTLLSRQSVGFRN